MKMRFTDDKTGGVAEDQINSGANQNEAAVVSQADELVISPTMVPVQMNGTAPSMLTSGAYYGKPEMMVSNGHPLSLASPDGPLEGNTLLDQLKTQLEYYFSRENLNHDMYLVSQMDSDQYVDISIIANFNQVKKLTNDMPLIIRALRESAHVQVDDAGRKVRPLHKRSIIILREIPEGTTQQEVEGIFKHEKCPPFMQVEYASGNCWYVHFDTEDQTQQAFSYIREILQTFKGTKIMARIKAKPSVQNQTPRSDRGSASSDIVSPTPVQVSNGPPPTIRYPVPLPHIPMAPPYTVQLSPNVWPYGYQYMMQPPVISTPPWLYADPAMALDGFQMMPTIPQPHPRPPHPYSNPAGPGPHSRSGRGPGEKNHSRANSSGSDRISLSDRQEPVNQNGAVTVAGNPTVTQVQPTNGQVNRPNHQSYNGPSNLRNRPATMSNHPPPREPMPRHRVPDRDFYPGGPSYRPNNYHPNGNHNHVYHHQPPHQGDRRDLGAPSGPPHSGPHGPPPPPHGGPPQSGLHSQQHHHVNKNRYVVPPRHLPHQAAHNNQHHPMINNNAQSRRSNGPHERGLHGPPGTVHQRNNYNKPGSGQSERPTGSQSELTSTKHSPTNSKSVSPDKDIKPVSAHKNEAFEFDNTAFPALPPSSVSAPTQPESATVSTTAETVAETKATATSQIVSSANEKSATDANPGTKVVSQPETPAILNEPAKLSDIVKGTVKQHNLKPETEGTVQNPTKPPIQVKIEVKSTPPNKEHKPPAATPKDNKPPVHLKDSKISPLSKDLKPAATGKDLARPGSVTRKAVPAPSGKAQPMTGPVTKTQPLSAASKPATSSQSVASRPLRTAGDNAASNSSLISSQKPKSVPSKLPSQPRSEGHNSASITTKQTTSPNNDSKLSYAQMLKLSPTEAATVPTGAIAATESHDPDQSKPSDLPKASDAVRSAATFLPGDTNNNPADRATKDQNGFIPVERRHDHKSKNKKDSSVSHGNSISERTHTEGASNNMMTAS